MAMSAENQARYLTCLPSQDLRVPTMSEYNRLPMLKFKITTKGIRNDSEDKPKNGRGVGDAKDRHEHSDVNVLVKRSMPAITVKRKPETSIDGHMGKRQKMDSHVKLQCRKVLKDLMNHHAGWIFSDPVDPVKLHIPDYFSVIAHPMDLGTIKNKLEGNVYSTAEEFAADVRLTFSNAMLYNPPENKVHSLAKELDGNFSRLWKSTETKLKLENKNVKQVIADDDMGKTGRYIKPTVKKNCQATKPIGLNKGLVCVNLGTSRPNSSEVKNYQVEKPIRNKTSVIIKCGTSRPMSSEDKKKFKLELLRVSSRKMSENLRNLFQRFGLTGHGEERICSYIDTTDDETLCKFRKEIKLFEDARDRKVESARTSQNGSLRTTVHKELCSRSPCACANHRQSVDSTATKCSCGSLTCHCHLKDCSALASSSDLSSVRSSETGNCGDSELECEVKNALASNTSSSGVDSDGPGVVLNEENRTRISTPAPTAASDEGWTPLSCQMSPNKALRAAMLKSRFADTIFKATHQPVLDHGNKLDPTRRQQERERLEREQRAEKARIESEIKAAEAASRRRAQDELKVRRQREREAAKIALEKMEKTVEIDGNLGFLKELEMLCRSPVDGKAWFRRNPLEQLGLYIKDDYDYYDYSSGDDESEDPVLIGEEGEILS